MQHDDGEASRALSKLDPSPEILHWGIREGRSTPTALSYSVKVRLPANEFDASECRLTLNEDDIAAMGGKAVGDYGEGVAENYLNSRGVEVSRQVWFNGSNGKFRADLFDPKTRTIYEVKTGQFELGLLGYQIDDCRHALTTHQVNHAIYLNVEFLGKKGFSSELLASLSGLGVVTLV